jgi:hypothetical protein
LVLGEYLENTSTLLPRLGTERLFLFGDMKRLLQGTEFQTAEELLDGVVQILVDIPFETLMTTFHEWLQKLQARIDCDGEYVEYTFFDSKNFSRISTGNRDAKECVEHPVFYVHRIGISEKGNVLGAVNSYQRK